MGCGHRLQGEVTASQGNKKTLWISLGAVAVVGLAVGGYFIFSSDQPADEKNDKAGVGKGGKGEGGGVDAALSGDWSYSKGKAAKSQNNVGYLGKGVAGYSADHEGQLPRADKWCDDIFDQVGSRKGYISPQAPNAEELKLEGKHCHYTMNAAVTGEYEFNVLGLVLLFESDLGWNSSGGLEDAKKFAKDRKVTKMAVVFVGGSSRLVAPEELESLKWTP